MATVISSEPDYSKIDKAAMAANANHPEPKKLHPEVDRARIKDTITTILLFRLVNALLLATFFQPDEYYQALEPAWNFAFGQDSGAIITWEWTHELRSSLFPMALGVFYKAIGFLSGAMLPPVLRAKILVIAPRLVSVPPAAIMDIFTWMLGERVMGTRTPDGMALLVMLIFSPWQWLVSTRTLSNTVETTLTVVALYYWPWNLLIAGKTAEERTKDLKRFYISMSLAALACVIRPTNVLVWLVLASYTLPYANLKELAIMVRDASIFGTVVLVISAYSDMLYYGKWTNPAANFYHFNVTERISSFYGINRLDYYFTEGIPSLLVLFTPFAAIGLWQALTGSYPVIKKADGTMAPSPPLAVMRGLAVIGLGTPIALSFVAHKEARFIYPIFPILSILAARPFAVYFKPLPSPALGVRRWMIRGIILTHVLLAVYLGSIHNRGVVKVMSFLRSEFEKRNSAMVEMGDTTNVTTVTFGMLMPCYSTPWRSHLVYPELQGWALSCEPPIDVPMDERDAYVDMADKFYEDPVGWMRFHFGSRRLVWPDYVVFYEQLLPSMKEVVANGGFRPIYRTFNSVWHPDWRRRGDVIVWRKESDAERMPALQDPETGLFNWKAFGQ